MSDIMDIINVIKTFEEKDKAKEVIQYFAERATDSDTMVYRGYRKGDELLPTLYRKEHSAEEYRTFEETMLRDICKYGTQYMHGNTGIEIVANAQHYGLPTRLLDFTWNPFVALFFAMYNKVEKDETYRYVGCIDISEQVLFDDVPEQTTDAECITLNEESMRDKGIALKDYFEGIALSGEVKEGDTIVKYISKKCGIDPNERKAAAERVRERLASGRLVFAEAGWSNPRILMQQGLFLIPHALYSGGETPVQDVLRTRLKKQMNAIKIHTALRAPILEILSRMGFDTYHLMPDFESACRALRDKYSEIAEKKGAAG